MKGANARKAIYQTGRSRRNIGFSLQELLLTQVSSHSVSKSAKFASLNQLVIQHTLARRTLSANYALNVWKFAYLVRNPDSGDSVRPTYKTCNVAELKEEMGLQIYSRQPVYINWRRISARLWKYCISSNREI